MSRAPVLSSHDACTALHTELKQSFSLSNTPTKNHFTQKYITCCHHMVACSRTCPDKVKVHTYSQSVCLVAMVTHVCSITKLLFYVKGHHYIYGSSPALLRPLTRGKCFLLFLPDSHSAYYDSFVSAHGWSLPPRWVFQGFFALGQVSGGNGGRGGLTHLRLQHWVKWLWEQVWDFSALGGPTNSVSRRVVKLTVSHYYLVPLPLQKRGYGDEI